MKQYAKDNKIEKLIYKRIPAIYQTYPSDEDLYALFRYDAKLIRRDIGYTVDIQNQIKWIQAIRTNFNKATKNNITARISVYYEEYHKILSDTLDLAHKTNPVHSIKEMELLAKQFPENIQLVCSYKDDQIVSGAWLFIEKTQYIHNI